MDEIRSEPNETRGGLNLVFDLAGGADIQMSPRWMTGGRHVQFYRLAPRQILSLPAGRNFIKVIFGELASPKLSCLADPFSVRSTDIDTSEVAAGPGPVLMALMTLPPGAPEFLENPVDVLFEGEHADTLRWQSFHAKYGAFLDAFEGLDCHMADGFHLLDEQGVELVYVNPWICGKQVDLTTHNHANDPSARSPAFAEIHWVLASGTDSGGMYSTSAPGASERVRYPMSLGEEHGPFYDTDQSGRPVRRQNGAVQYPWHGWQGGSDDNPGQRYDYVWAFEINPDLIDACIVR